MPPEKKRQTDGYTEKYESMVKDEKTEIRRENRWTEEGMIIEQGQRQRWYRDKQSESDG